MMKLEFNKKMKQSTMLLQINIHIKHLWTRLYIIKISWSNSKNFRIRHLYPISDIKLFNCLLVAQLSMCTSIKKNILTTLKDFFFPARGEYVTKQWRHQLRREGLSSKFQIVGYGIFIFERFNLGDNSIFGLWRHNLIYCQFATGFNILQ